MQITSMEKEFVKILKLKIQFNKAALKNTEVNLELLTDTDMLLMIEKGIKGGICNTNH